MPKAIQAKHLSEEAILEVLQRNPGRWHTHWQGHETSVCDPTHPDAPEKVLLAKLAAMARRGLIKGCPCGCRGDWHVEQPTERREDR